MLSRNKSVILRKEGLCGVTGSSLVVGAKLGGKNCAVKIKLVREIISAFCC
jgi:hypothetical protein